MRRVVAATRRTSRAFIGMAGFWYSSALLGSSCSLNAGMLPRASLATTDAYGQKVT